MKSVTEEDESYAKPTTRPPVNDDKTADSNIVEVLGLIWNITTDESTFDLSDLSDKIFSDLFVFSFNIVWYNEIYLL